MLSPHIYGRGATRHAGSVERPGARAAPRFVRLFTQPSTEDGAAARAALSALVNVGIDVRTISYLIHHDKVIVADRQTGELGSFNYSDAAARKNSENVLDQLD